MGKEEEKDSSKYWGRKRISKCVTNSKYKILQKNIDCRINTINAHIVNKDLVRGKIVFNDGEIQEGDLFNYPRGFSLQNGTVIFPEGNNPKMVRGKFSKRTGFFIEGQIIHGDGDVHEGEFDRDEGTLKKGRKFEVETGNIYDGEFDIESRNIINGKIIYGPKQKNGVIYKEGVFDIDTEHLVKGRILYTDGQLEEGQFDKNSGVLMKGKIYKNGITYKINDIQKKKINKKRNTCSILAPLICNGKQDVYLMKDPFTDEQSQTT